MSTNTNTPYDEDSINVDAMEKAAGGRAKNLPFKDGTNIYRILPPFGKVAKEKGFPYAEIGLHWWRTEGDKSGFPVRCTKKTDPAGCPICDLVEKLQAELDLKLKPFTVGDKKVDWNKVPREIGNLAKYVKEIGWQRHYYYNAVSTAGEIGVLKVSKTLGDKLNAKMKECVQKRKFNPVSRLEGVYFLLTRTKMDNGKYDFEVDLQKKTVKLEDGDTAEKVVKSPLPEEVLARLESSMQDLYELFKPQTAASLKKVMAGDTKKANLDFNPADFGDDEGGEPDFNDEEGPSTKDAKSAPEDIEDPSEDDIDALAEEIGAK